MSQQAQELIGRAETRRAARALFDGHFEEIRQIFYPIAASFFGTSTAGEKVHQHVLDSTPEQCVDLLVAGILSRTTPAHEKWFSLRAMDDALNEVDDVRAWLTAVEDRLFSVFASPTSNFVPQQHEKILDLVTFGTGVMFVADDPGRQLPLFQTRPLAECCISEDANGTVDSVDRWFKLTARQAFGKWGADVGEKVVEAAQDWKKQDQIFDFLHCVYPRGERDMTKRDRRNMAVASCYINVSEKSIIREAGFDEFPYSVARWSKRAGEVYGRGPGHKTLADGKLLQRVMRATIRGGEKVVDPPLLVADDGVLGPVRLNSGSLNYARAELMRENLLPIRPLMTGSRPDIGEDMMGGIRKRMEAGFFTTLLQFARDPRMTATQSLQLDEQAQLALAPLIARMQSEDLNPTIQRTYAIELRNERLPPAPEALAGREIKIEYVSPLVRLQKVSRARALAQSMEIVGPLAREKPEMMDNLDTDKIAREVPELLGVPNDWLRPVAKVAEIRQARQEAAAAAAEADSMARMAEGAGKAAPMVKALTDTTQVVGNA